MVAFLIYGLTLTVNIRIIISTENIWEALFLCHQLFRAVSGEVAERLHYAYPEYDRNITKYTRDMYKKYTGKTGCLDSTYAADIEERREQ